MKIRHTDHRDRIDVPMTPMIDIVFQLLVFFIMSFKIVLPEGDFNIRMPLPASEAPAPPSELPTLTLRMEAGEGGELARLRLGARVLEGPTRFQQLRAEMKGLVGVAAAPEEAVDQEVEINADYGLHYEHVMRAITALSGYVENGQRHQLIEKIRLTPPREPAGEAP